MIFVLAILATFHLILVTVGAVTPLINIFYEWLERGPDDPRYQLNNRLAQFSIMAWIAGAIFGLLLGVASWSDELSGALSRLSSKVNYGIIEYFFSLVLMVAYLFWRKRVDKPGIIHRSLRCLFPLAAGTNSIYHFPVLFAVVGELQRRGIWNGEVINASQFRQEWLVQAIVWSKSIHVVTAGVAFAGMTLLMIAAKAQRQNDEPLYRTAALAGARLALLAVVAQILTGFWLITSLDPVQQKLLMGGDTFATLAFGGGVFLAFTWMHLLGRGMVTPLEGRSVSRIALVGILAMLLMVTATRRERDVSRRKPPEEAVGADIRHPSIHTVYGEPKGLLLSLRMKPRLP
jgi:cytochrome bd-type quinol oxidase subunit 2